MRIGILGYGSIGSRHGRNLVSLGHKVIFHDPNIAEGSLPKDEVIKRSDAVVIASPTSEHANDILLCSEANKPCFVEKPIADKKLNQHGWPTWPLMVGYNLRFHPCVRKAKEWLNDDRLGTPYWANFICAQFNDKPEYLRDGVTLNWSHEVDLALHLLGKAEVTGAAITEKDDISDILLRHSESGARTAIHLDYVTRPEHRGFSICGPKGVMVANIPARSIALLDADGIPKHVEQYQGSFDHDYVVEMVSFIARAGGPGDPTLGCTAEEAIEVLKICLKAKKEAGI